MDGAGPSLDRPKIVPWGTPAPSKNKGAYRHDGLYLRVGVGLGKLDSQPLLNLSETALLFELGAGWALADGLVLGARVLGARSNPQIEYYLNEPSSRANGVTQYEGFVDVYPTRRGDLHIQAGFGPSVVTFPAGVAGKSTGSGLTLGLGGQFWVSENWGIGGMLNIHFDWYNRRSTSNPSLSNADDMFTPSLMLTATYN